jgi:hypothetical protein
MSKPAPSRPAQFRALLARAASELGVKRSDDLAQRLATVRLQRRAIRELQQHDLLSGKLSDPSKLLDADDRLRQEEERLAAMAPREVGGPSFIIEPLRMIVRERAPSQVVELPIPTPEPIEAKPEASKPSNVVALPVKPFEPAHDFHSGVHACVKQPDTLARDPNLGAFTQDPTQRDPHIIDHNAFPLPRGAK